MGLGHVCWSSWLFCLCHACDREFEQQEELRVSPTEWKKVRVPFISSLLAIICAVIMVIKERNLCSTYKHKYYTLRN